MKLKKEETLNLLKQVEYLVSELGPCPNFLSEKLFKKLRKIKEKVEKRSALDDIVLEKLILSLMLNMIPKEEK